MSTYFRTRHFGFGAANTGDVTMRVQVVLSKVDKDGYAIDTTNVWGDVSPNEKRRFWAGLNLSKKDAFRNYRIKEIGIAVAQQGVAPYVASTAPNREVYDMFASSLSSVQSNSILDTFNLSVRSQGAVMSSLGLGVRSYFKIAKWVLIGFGVLILLRIAMFALAFALMD